MTLGLILTKHVDSNFQLGLTKRTRNLQNEPHLAILLKNTMKSMGQQETMG